MKGNTLDKDFSNFPSLIHQAALAPHLDGESLNQICDAALHFNFAAICTNLLQIPRARKRLGSNLNTKLIAVISFPFGNTPSFLKRQQAEWAIDQGAEQLDVAPNFFYLNKSEVDQFAEDLSIICELGIPVRSIIDISNLSKEKLSLAVNASIEAGVYGIQTGNGFGSPISCAQVKELFNLVKDRCKIKSVGSIKTLQHSIDLIEAGSSEIGTSMGASIMKELKSKNQ